MWAETWKQRQKNDFENAKAQCLGKRDKSFQGRIDPRAVEVCGIINEREDMFTTSSCAGRCFMYRGNGIKATSNFSRFRLSHEKIEDPTRYFDLTTIDTDPSGGGDPIRTIGQYDYRALEPEGGRGGDDGGVRGGSDLHSIDAGSNVDELHNTKSLSPEEPVTPLDIPSASNQTIWLRFEPFILHVACRSLSAASMLMSTARPAFKNVGLTTWKERRYLVAIWGDEGLEMPLCTPTGQPLYCMNTVSKDGSEFVPRWLAQLCNERHDRNWKKIQRFCQSLRGMEPPVEDYEEFDISTEDEDGSLRNKLSKSFDVIGDVAYINSMADDEDPKIVGASIMAKNKSIKVVVARRLTLAGFERAPGSEGLEIIAGAVRSPLITTHTEYGIKCVIDLNHTFFSPNMAKERLRICQLVARGEDVLVCFGGVGMEAFQIAGRTEASRIVYVELNDIAVECARRGLRMLERNKSVKCAGAAERLQIIQGDVLEVVPNLSSCFDRILAPRPKEGKLDSDMGAGDGGIEFLKVLLTRLNHGGECHWYDFVADWEFPTCGRTKSLIGKVCQECDLKMKVLHVAHAGSVAKRQLRICMDFKVFQCDTMADALRRIDASIQT